MTSRSYKSEVYSLKSQTAEKPILKVNVQHISHSQKSGSLDSAAI